MRVVPVLQPVAAVDHAVNLAGGHLLGRFAVAHLVEDIAATFPDQLFMHVLA